MSRLKSLKYKENWPQARRRMEAWWRGRIIDRPPIMITAPRDKSFEEQHEETEVSPEDYFTKPEIVLTRMKKRIKNTYWAGEAFPVMRPVPGKIVAILASYLGSPRKYPNKETTWSEPIIESWEEWDMEQLSFNSKNELWKISRKLLKKGSKDAKNKYYIGIPDLNGPSEIVSRLRGTDRFLKDVIRNPNYIKKAIRRVNYTWFRYWQACHGIVHQYVGGYVFWMGIWSDTPATDLQSDVSCMISPKSFKKIVLPAIKKQIRWIPRTIYHLDGPDAIKHLDSLLSIDELDGIQWVPGAGASPASSWISLLKKIQEAGKLVYISAKKGEVGKLLSQLNPKGLLIKTECDSPKEADDMIESIKRRYG
ncbi:hypothetical protein KGY79_02880 [Candidatus Bipolaricaulota bacterium]|nr:hypothetical protein [Candidatus Bipolaricaulota bacterium]